MIHLSEQVRLIELHCINRIDIICVTFAGKSQTLWTTYLFTEKIEIFLNRISRKSNTFISSFMLQTLYFNVLVFRRIPDKTLAFSKRTKIVTKYPTT